MAYRRQRQADDLWNSVFGAEHSCDKYSKPSERNGMSNVASFLGLCRQVQRDMITDQLEVMSDEAIARAKEVLRWIDNDGHGSFDLRLKYEPSRRWR